MQVSFNMQRNNQIRLPAQPQRTVSGQKDKTFPDKNITTTVENREVSKKQIGWMEAWIEKNKEKDFGILMGGGVSTVRPMNWDADGTSKLTQEQLDYLKSNYDLSDMSKQDYYDLMADLTNMNAISIEDVVSQHMKPMIPGVAVMSISESDSERGFAHFNKYGNLKENLLQYMEDLDYMDEWLVNGHSVMDTSTFFAFKNYLSDEKALAGRLEFIFNLIA